ncbi:hypothetical protein FRB94_014306 [Tulasnella sp. JGI-2019a]|nr:hypothetical protein FRB94_014306 [Tulasnella sp. JGI-2019a]KAG8999635.1 hypothetical protein FRB93_013154 [Tulasnella sp. JGI-2019a]
MALQIVISRYHSFFAIHNRHGPRRKRYVLLQDIGLKGVPVSLTCSSAWAAVHDHCRKNKILIEKTEVQLGTPEMPSFALFLSFDGRNFVGGPEPNKKAALRAAAIQAAQALGLLVDTEPR